MSHRRITRRRLLKGLAGGGVLAPFVPLLETEATTMGPKRLIIVHHPNGWGTPDKWRPPGAPSETNFALTDRLSPLEPFQKNIILLDGLKNERVEGDLGGHSAMEPEILTGCVAVQTQPGFKSSTRATSASVDQVVAKAVGHTTRFDSLRFGVRNGPHRGQDTDGIAGAALVYSDANQPILPESNPYAQYERVFGTFNQVAANIDDSRLAADRDVLDLVSGALKRLGPKLSSPDRKKMEVHLDKIAALRNTLMPSGPGPGAPHGSCTVPTNEPGIDWQADADIPRITRAQMDIMVAALACDLTRVATFQFGNTGWGSTLSFLGHTMHDHDASHFGVAYHGQTVHWVAEQVAYLLDSLSKIPEPSPDGTMVGNTVLMWISEFGDGNDHVQDLFPAVLAGGAGGFWKTGRYLDWTDHTADPKLYPGGKGKVPHNNVLVTLCRAMGLGSVSTLGDPRKCTGPLDLGA